MYSALSSVHEYIRKYDHEYLPMYFENSLHDKIDRYIDMMDIQHSLLYFPSPKESRIFLGMPEYQILYLMNKNIGIQWYNSLTLDFYLNDISIDGLGLFEAYQSRMFTKESEREVRKLFKRLHVKDIKYLGNDSSWQFITPFLKYGDRLIPLTSGLSRKTYYMFSNPSQNSDQDSDKIPEDPSGLMFFDRADGMIIFCAKSDSGFEEHIKNMIQYSHASIYFYSTYRGSRLFKKLTNEAPKWLVENFKKDLSSNYIYRIYPTKIILEKHIPFYYNHEIHHTECDRFSDDTKKIIIQYSTRLQRISRDCLSDVSFVYP